MKERIVVPTPAKLDQIDVNELFVKIEFRAVVKIRLLFSYWFQQLAQNICNFSSKSTSESMKDMRCDSKRCSEVQGGS